MTHLEHLTFTRDWLVGLGHIAPTADLRWEISKAIVVAMQDLAMYRYFADSPHTKAECTNLLTQIAHAEKRAHAYRDMRDDARKEGFGLAVHDHAIDADRWQRRSDELQHVRSIALMAIEDAGARARVYGCTYV